ncbi:MAG: DUF2079 domain-containing protein [Candidatus Omnitrophota bacterium]
MKIFLEKYLTQKITSVLLWAFIGIYVSCFSVISFLKFYSFSYTDYDLAYFSQIVWNICHGSLYSSILGMVFLGVHVQLIWFIIAPIYFVLPHPMTLLILQSLALGVAACPLYLLAKQALGHKWGLLVSSMYLIYPAVGYINLFELHSTAFLPFFMFSMFYFFHNKRFALFMLFLFLAVFCQENIALVALGMGFYAAYKRRGLKWVFVPVISAGVYFLICVKIIMPYFNEDTVQFIYLYNQLGNSTFQIAANIFTHPLQIMKIMLAPQKCVYLFQLFSPLSFISLFSPLWLLAAFPLFAQHLLSSRITQVMIYYHYSSELIAFIFVAFVFGIKSLLRFKKIAQYRLFFGIFLFFVSIVSTFSFGPHFKLLGMATRDYIKDDSDHQKEAFLKKVPFDAPIMATFEFLPRMANRRELYSFHHHYMGHYTLSSRPYRVPDTVRYALLDFNDNLTFNSFYSPQGYKNTQELLSRGKWGVADAKDSIVLFRKDAQDKMTLYSVLSLEPNPEHNIPVAIDQQIEFLGFDDKEIDAQSMHLTFYWRSLKETQSDFIVFIDFIDENGKDVYRALWPICYRIYPTNAWRSGQWIAEEAYLTIPSHLAPGRYSLEMGFFDFRTRLLYFANSQDPLGRIFLRELVINAKKS